MPQPAESLRVEPGNIDPKKQPAAGPAQEPWFRLNADAGVYSPALRIDAPGRNPPPQPPVPGSVHLDGFEDLVEVARGGAGIVYRARQREPQRIVAVKVLTGLDRRDATAAARFDVEADTLAGLRHPNLVQVFETGARDDAPYLVLEFVEGGSLADRLRSGPLAPRTAAELLETIARAVQHAHEHGILHRDLKPGNILLTRDGVPKVADFGLAKNLAADVHLTETGRIVGTPSYMAPEQLRAQRALTTAVDVYGLGAILYESLTGGPPFAGRSGIELLVQVDSREPAAPSSVRAGVPRDLDTICLACLRKEPAQRYPTASALADDLRRFLDAQPISARPVGPAERLWMWCRRNPVVASLAAAVAALLVGLAVGGPLVAWHEADLRHRWQLAEAAQGQAARDALAAASAERQAKDAEAAERKAAEEVADLLTTMFRGLDPRERQEGAPDFKAQLVARLEQTAADLETKYPGQPLLRARLRNALGLTQMGLGEYAQAVVLFEAAATERKNLLGPTHAESLSTLNNLAAAHRLEGRLDQAAEMHQEVLAARRATLVADHEDTLTTMNNLAEVYRVARKFDKSRELHEEVLKARQSTLGLDHPQTLNSLNNLGLVYRALGKVDQAVLHLEQALVGMRKQLGVNHMITLTCMNNLARAYQADGKLERAIALFQETLASMQAALGPDHPDTLTCRINLAVAYQAADQPAEAPPVLEPVWTSRRGKLGPDHASTLSALSRLADAHLAANQPEKALPLYEEFLKLHAAKLGDASPALANHLAMIAQELLQASQFAAAEPLVRQCLAIRQEKLPDDWATFRAKSLLGGSLLGQQKLADAEPLLLEGFAGMKLRQEQIPANLRRQRLAEAARRVVQLYEAQGKPELAEPFRKEAASSP